MRQNRPLHELKQLEPTDLLSTKEACLYMGVSVETLTGYFKHRGLPRWNASPTGGLRGPFFYRKGDLDKLVSESFEVMVSTSTVKKNKPRQNARAFASLPDVVLRN